MVERRFTFDAVAELYDASRPGYPVALIDRVSQAAGLRHGDDVLEIGGGTGKATKPFAERGFRVVALEPGSNLIRVARRSLVQFANVEFMASTFEDWPLETAKFKLVFAAQSFHWIAPDVRFSKAALALAPGGALAVFGSTALPLASQLRDDVTPIYERVAPHLAGFDLGPGWYRPGGELNKLFDELPPPFSASSHTSTPGAGRILPRVMWTTCALCQLSMFSRSHSVKSCCLGSQRPSLLMEGCSKFNTKPIYIWRCERLESRTQG